MWMPDKSGAEPPVEDEALAEIQSTTRGAFRLVYGFILQAVKGDKATADAIFEDYLAGKLSEELLSISRRCVSADQAGSSNRDIAKGWRSEKSTGGTGVNDDTLNTAAVA